MELRTIGFLLLLLVKSTWMSEIRPSSSGGGDYCPTECFCQADATITTCIGDHSLTTLPPLNSTSFQIDKITTTPQHHRLEIRDYILPILLITSSESQLLFQTVEELILSHNQIQSIQYERSEEMEVSLQNKTIITNIFKLKVLDLSNNNLTQFQTGPELTNLRILDLSHNSLTNINLTGLAKVESLNLRSNSIQELAEDTFQTLKSLHYINLDTNRLQILSPNLFSNLPALAHLILSTNPLQLSHGFLFNSRTQFIDVSHVGLSLVPPSLTKTIRDLRLNNNQLRIIGATDFESYPNLGLLVLDENQIESVEEDALGRLEFLSGLWLNGNSLSRVPQNLPPSLKSLQLEENRISFLNQSDFGTLRNLESLNLQTNALSSLEPDVFSSLPSLKTLNLRGNQIETLLPTTFTNLSSLLVLDLSQNPIKVIVNGAFGSLVSLNVLHLSRITEKDTELQPALLFKSLETLQILDLSNSAGICARIIPGLLYLKSLRELNMERCELSRTQLGLLCDQIQDVETIRIIKAAGNPFLKEFPFYGNGLSIFIPSKLCPSNQIPTTTTTILPLMLFSTFPSSTKVSLPVSSVSTTLTLPRIPGTSLHSNIKVGATESELRLEHTSSYFDLLETNEESHPEKIRGNDEDPQSENSGISKSSGSIDGFPVPPKTMGLSPTLRTSNFHHLPPKMLLQSHPIRIGSGGSDGGSIMMKSVGDEGTNHNLIFRTILISILSCLVSVFLLLGLALALFRIHGGRLLVSTVSNTRNQTITTGRRTYERLEEKTEVELGIRNRVYSPVEESPIYTIS